MERRPKPGTVFDGSGTPIRPVKDSIEDLNLPPGTQALIEERLNSAKDQVRDFNQADLRRIADEYSRKWKKFTFVLSVVAAASVFFNIYAFFFAPKSAQEHVRTFIRERVAEPAMRASLEEVAREKATAYVNSKLLPLEVRTDSADKRITEVNSELTRQQAVLSAEQVAFKEQLRLQELSIAARVGDAGAFDALKAIASQNGDIGRAAEILVRDVRQYFESDRHSFGQRVFIDPVSKAHLTLSIDEAVRELRNDDPPMRAAAANRLHDIGSKAAISALCEAALNEKNLTVVARITRAVAKITGKEFDPVDRAPLRDWWSANKSKEEFVFPSAAFTQGILLFRHELLATTSGDFSQRIYPHVAEPAVRSLRAVLEKIPEAHFARFHLCLALCALGQIEASEKELETLLAKDASYRFAPIVGAYIAMSKNSSDVAADALKGALPSARNLARRMAIFAPLSSDKRIDWSASSQ